MHADWLNINPPHPDFAALIDTTTVSILSDCGLLEITGPDSAKFLQGQLTCSLKDITPTQTRPGAHCTPKGRMVASFLLSQAAENSYRFCLPSQSLAPLQTALGKYIVFSKAKLQDVSGQFLLLGVSGPEACTQIATVLGAAPNERYNQIQTEAATVICVTSNPLRFLCMVDATQAQHVYQQLTTSCTPTTQHYWNWLNIREGIGEVRAATCEEFIPQMLNMQLLDGISFNKGCYTGQEIVARMQYRGTLKKAMYRIAGTGSAPADNSALYRAGDAQAAGHVLMAETVGSNQWEALAVIPHDAIHASLHTQDDTEIHMLPLPYAIPTGDEKS